MMQVIDLNLTIEQLREMKARGGAVVVVEIEDNDTHQKTRLHCPIPIETIERMLVQAEAGQRAMNN